MSNAMNDAKAAAVTDIEAAHRGHALAVDNLRLLENRLAQAFQRLYDARAELQNRAGVDAIVHLDEPMTCAWDRWLATHEAHAKAVAPESLDAHREEEALRLANAAHKGHTA